MAWQPTYITDAELKSYVRLGDTLDDAEVTVANSAAARAIDTAARRQFGQVASAETRSYYPEWDRHHRTWTLIVDDVQDLTGFAIHDPAGAVVSSSNYVMLPYDADKRARPFEAVRLSTGVPQSYTWWSGLTYESNPYTVTGKWGWTAVPDTIKLANRLQGSRFLARRDSPFGIAGSPANGSELRLFDRLDPDVALSIRSYLRKTRAAL